MVPGFRWSETVDVMVPCTYDFEVIAAKYLHALEEGDISLLLMFSGTIFRKARAGSPSSRRHGTRRPPARFRCRRGEP